MICFVSKLKSYNQNLPIDHVYNFCFVSILSTTLFTQIIFHCWLPGSCAVYGWLCLQEGCKTLAIKEEKEGILVMVLFHILSSAGMMFKQNHVVGSCFLKLYFIYCICLEHIVVSCKLFSQDMFWVCLVNKWF